MLFQTLFALLNARCLNNALRCLNTPQICALSSKGICLILGASAQGTPFVLFYELHATLLLKNTISQRKKNTKKMKEPKPREQK